MREPTRNCSFNEIDPGPEWFIFGNLIFTARDREGGAELGWGAGASSIVWKIRRYAIKFVRLSTGELTARRKITISGASGYGTFSRH